jgi:hypothetical protein
VKFLRTFLFVLALGAAPGDLHGGTLTGHVRDPNWFAKYQNNPFGVGYYEYGVNANGENLGATGGFAATDVFGLFTMPGLAAGEYTVSSWDVWWRPAFAFGVPVPGTGSTSDVDLRLHATMWGYPAFWDNSGWFEFGQTFVATGPVHMIYLRVPFNTTYTLSVREDGPAGARVPGSPDRTFTGGGDVRVIYGFGEMPTVAGRTYYVRIRTSAPNIGGVIMQMDPRPDFSDPMPGGMLHLGNAGGTIGVPDRDLGLVIMCDDDGILTNLHTRESGGQNFSGTNVGQSFIARGVNLLSAAFWLADPSAPVYVVRVFETGPGGAQVGTTKRGKPPRLNADPEMMVTWSPGECPLVPGRTYYVEVTRDGGGSFGNVYTNNTNPFAFGAAYRDGAVQSSFDLAGTLMEEEAEGSATMAPVHFTSDPTVSEADRGTTEIVVRWNTDVPSDSKVEFAEETPPYSRSVFDATPKTDHVITLPALTPHTLHHYRVTSAATDRRPGIFRDQVICTRPAAPNLLTNPGFELGSGASPRAITGWTATGQLDLKASNGSWFSNLPPHTGNWLAQGSLNGSTSDAYLYQRVSGTVPGRRYTFSAWVTTWPRENNTFKYDVWQDQGRLITMRLGIDPTGGTDPAAATVQWTPRMFSHLHWTNLAKSAVAKENACTVFISMKGDGVQWHLYGIDDVALSTEGPEALPQLNLVVADRAANTLTLTFSDAIDSVSAGALQNYLVVARGTAAPLGVTSVQVIDAFTVRLTTAPQEKYVDYDVKVSGVNGPLKERTPPIVNGTSPTRVTYPLVTLDATTAWRFQQSGADQGTAWRAPEFNDTAWPVGAALFAQETAALPEPIRTPLTVSSSKMTFYFRTRFDAPRGVGSAPLRVRHVIDDGAVFWLNGAELHRIAMNDPLASSAPASRQVDNAVYEGPFDYPARGLRSSGNVLAVEVHQNSSTSGDIVFGATLDALILPSQLPRPILVITRQGENVVLEWSGPPATLQSADFAEGPWTDLLNATSPHTVPIDRAARFFRLRE